MDGKSSSWACGALVLLFASGALGCFSAPGYRGPESPHFDGSEFSNLVPTPAHSFADFLNWQLMSEPGPWSDWTESPPGPPPPRRVQGEALRVTFVNHATVLVQVAGLNLLTDPIWSERSSPVGFAGPARVRPPGVRLEDLPPIDFVLLSHNHYDHLDVETLRVLGELSPGLRIVTGLGNAALLAEQELPVGIELDWWQELDLGPAVRVTAVPAQHFSGRGTDDRNQTLWLGFVVQAPGGPIYFAGDTGWGIHLAQIRKRFGPPRLALLPIAPFRPCWFMSPVHLSPKGAVQAHELLGAAHSMAIHFGTFPLGDDGQEEPVTELGRALATEQVPSERFIVPGFGTGYDVL